MGSSLFAVHNTFFTRRTARLYILHPPIRLTHNPAGTEPLLRVSRTFLRDWHAICRSVDVFHWINSLIWDYVVLQVVAASARSSHTDGSSSKPGKKTSEMVGVLSSRGSFYRHVSAEELRQPAGDDGEWPIKVHDGSLLSQTRAPARTHTCCEERWKGG